MKYLESYGAVWKLSDRSYRRFIRDVAEGKAWNLDDYGKQIIDAIVNVTDFDQEAAQTLLQDEKFNRRIR